FQAGIEPSALPAISAPIGVKLLPSLSASAAGTAAMTLVASSVSPRNPAWNRLFVVFIGVFVLKMQCLEVHAEAERNEVAVIHSGVLAVKEVGVRQGRGVGVLVLGVETQADRFATFLEVATRARRVAVHVMGPGNVRLEVYTGEHAVVVPD